MEAMNTLETELLTLPDAARLLAISTRTLWRLINRREFPRPLKIGSASRVAREDVHAYKLRLLRERDAKE